MGFSLMFGQTGFHDTANTYRPNRGDPGIGFGSYWIGVALLCVGGIFFSFAPCPGCGLTALDLAYPGTIALALGTGLWLFSGIWRASLYQINQQLADDDETIWRRRLVIEMPKCTQTPIAQLQESIV